MDIDHSLRVERASAVDHSRMHKRCGELLIALAADQVLGELPTVYHPVVWMGRWLALGEHLAPGDDLGRLAWGGAWIVAGAGVCAALAAALPRAGLVRGL